MRLIAAATSRFRAGLEIVRFRRDSEMTRWYPGVGLALGLVYRP